ESLAKASTAADAAEASKSPGRAPASSSRSLSESSLGKLRAKKAELEESYRQDCDTFTVVVKMLISKDPQLESRIRSALKETLREIGQQCVEELRDYVRHLESGQVP
ncbi:hypothetical protein BOX15_Mlig005491g1, partial [Macrostomum lignano]